MKLIEEERKSRQAHSQVVLLEQNVRDLREKSLNRKKQNKNYVSQSNLTISA
jgi:hypothetical protein